MRAIFRMAEEVRYLVACQHVGRRVVVRANYLRGPVESDVVFEGHLVSVARIPNAGLVVVVQSWSPSAPCGIGDVALLLSQVRSIERAP